MKISQKSYDFAQLVLKKYKPDKEHWKFQEEENKLFETLTQKNLQKAADQNTIGDSSLKKPAEYRDPNDYGKWQNIEKKMQKLEDKREFLKNQEEQHLWGCAKDHRKERDIYERPNKEKLETAQYFKDEGNKAFKEGDYHKASYMYQKVTAIKTNLYLVYTIAKGDEEDAIYNKLSLSTNLNLAAVKLKLEEFRDVISYAYQALRIEPENLKAKFRMAKAHTELLEFKEAYDLVNGVLGKDPKNKDFLKLIEEIQKAEEEVDASRKEISKSISQNPEMDE